MEITRTISVRHCIGICKEEQDGSLHEFRFLVPSNVKESRLIKYCKQHFSSIYDPNTPAELKSVFYENDEVSEIKLVADFYDFLNIAKFETVEE